MERMGFDRRGMAGFELDIVTAPAAHPLDEDLFGIRRARFSTSGRSRSGDGPTIYYIAFPSFTFMMTAAPAGEPDDLSPDQHWAIEAVIESLESLI